MALACDKSHTMAKKGVRPPSTSLLALGLESFDALVQAELGQRGVTTKGLDTQSSPGVRRAVVAVLRAAALTLVSDEERAGVRQFRLFDDAFCAVRDVPTVSPFTCPEPEVEELGHLLEALLSRDISRKQQGMFFTPRIVVDDVTLRATRAFSDPHQPLPRVVDPACGGGAFILGVARALEQTRGIEGQPEERRKIIHCLYGFDIEPLAVAISELSLALWAHACKGEASLVMARFRCKDSLAFESQASRETFDLVIGNPPWVAYAGRATQPLTLERRRWLGEQYQAFRGYPTLHACFVELGARLSSHGRVALLVPSPVADLDGYRQMRRALTRTHRVLDELVEYGQDAFEGVVQPCFGLIADASSEARESDAPFSLVERTEQGGHAARVSPPDVLLRLKQLPAFPPETFRELGFQTTSVVTQELLRRGGQAEPPFVFPLLEGKDVSEFRVGEPRVFLNADPEKLREARCKLRSIDEYRAVEFVVRQTAKYTIAAKHNGHAFRNSLLAGYGSAEFGAEVMVGLLNSSLLRALHLASQRDARQKTFPQVKVAHLRALPAPPPSSERAGRLAQWVLAHGSGPLLPPARVELDALVFDWYGVSADEADEVRRFFVERNGGNC